jgi:PGF-CTERM protein
LLKNGCEHLAKDPAERRKPYNLISIISKKGCAKQINQKIEPQPGFGAALGILIMLAAAGLMRRHD